MASFELEVPRRAYLRKLAWYDEVGDDFVLKSVYRAREDEEGESYRM